MIDTTDITEATTTTERQQTYYLLACRKDTDRDRNLDRARALAARLSTPDMQAVVYPSDVWWDQGDGATKGFAAWIGESTSFFDHLVVLVDDGWPIIGKGTADLVETFHRDERNVYALHPDGRMVEVDTLRRMLRPRDVAFFQWAEIIEAKEDEAP